MRSFRAGSNVYRREPSKARPSRALSYQHRLSWRDCQTASFMTHLASIAVGALRVDNQNGQLLARNHVPQSQPEHSAAGQLVSKGGADPSK